tara:strand:+ start:32 stop:454 length:423 start_codon:yes stop_codon:yes gene_type:complete
MSLIDAINTSIEGAFHYMNSSKYFAGIAMLLLNLGSRYISAELSEMHETVLNHKIIRRLLVFVVVFIATKDAKVSLILTAIFVILVSGIFNEESKYCIIPSVKNKNDITKTEYQLAQEVIKRYDTNKRRKEMQHIRSIKK